MTIKQYAESRGYHDVRYIKKWRGYDVYEPLMASDDISFIGLPLKILVRKNLIRMTTEKEAFEYIDDLKDDEE